MGHKQGYVTSEDIIKCLPNVDDYPAIRTELIDRLLESRIEIASGTEYIRMRIVEKAKHQASISYDEILDLLPDAEANISLLDDIMDDLLEGGIKVVASRDEYDLFLEAVDYVRQANKASISMLQKRFKIGYIRAKALIEMMEEQGIVGPAENGPNPRTIL